MKREIGLLILIILVIIVYFVMSHLKKRHYETIDRINDEKTKLFNDSIASDFYASKDMTLSGQSKETYESLVNRWNEIETVIFPTVEKHLFEAEQATDRFLFSKASSEEQNAETLISETNTTISSLSVSLEELMKNEEKNRKESLKVEQDYQQLRNDLLTNSFTYGKALEAMENQLTSMEKDFILFKSHTNAHDHIEANAVLDTLKEKIDILTDISQKVPAFFAQIDEVILSQLDEIEEGLKMMLEKGYQFQNENILEELAILEQDTVEIEEEVSQLSLEQAKEHIHVVSEKIEGMYDAMETEIRAKEFIRELAPDLRKAFTYLNEKNRQFRIETDRLNQRYVIDEKIVDSAPAFQMKIEDMKKEFEELSSLTSRNDVVFSKVQMAYEDMMNDMNELNDTQEEMQLSLTLLSEDEKKAKDQLDELQNEIYGIRRFMEMQRLPGLPEYYLDLYFETGNRLKETEMELSRNRLDLKKTNELLKLATEDVDQVIDESEKIIDRTRLTEYLVQYLNRFRKEHPEVSEVIDESLDVYTKEYDFEEALLILSEKAEEIEPGAFSKIQERYDTEKEQIKNEN